ESLAPRLDRLIGEEDHMRADLGRRVMQPYRRPLPDRFLLAREHAERGVDAISGRVQRGIENNVAARRRILADALAGEVERAAFTAPPRRRDAILGVDRPNPRDDSSGADRHAITNLDGARQDRPRHHSANAGEGKGAVDRESKATPCGMSIRASGGIENMLA